MQPQTEKCQNKCKNGKTTWKTSEEKCNIKSTTEKQQGKQAKGRNFHWLKAAKFTLHNLPVYSLSSTQSGCASELACRSRAVNGKAGEQVKKVTGQDDLEMSGDDGIVPDMSAVDNLGESQSICWAKS